MSRLCKSIKMRAMGGDTLDARLAPFAELLLILIVMIMVAAAASYVLMKIAQAGRKRLTTSYPLPAGPRTRPSIS